MNDHQDEIGSGEGWDISVQELEQKIKANSGVKNFRLIDVRSSQKNHGQPDGAGGDFLRNWDGAGRVEEATFS